MSRPEKIVRECAKCGVKFMAEKEGGDYQKFCCNCQESRRGRNEKRKMPRAHTFRRQKKKGRLS